MGAEDMDAAFETAMAAIEAGDANGIGEVKGDFKFTGIEDSDTDDGLALDLDDDSDGGETGEGENTNDDTEDTDGATSSDHTFDWAEYKDQLVKVKVHGQEVEVPLGEALNGYMRQADYTQKTQANAEALRMAEWAGQLRDAFAQDPAGTIQYLQQVYAQQQAPVNDPYDSIDPEFQPLVQQVRQQEQVIAQLKQQYQVVEQERVLSEVRAEVAQVMAEFPDFDAEKVLPIAADRGLSIRDAYLLAEAQTLVQSQKQAQKAAADAAAVAEREAAKRAAKGRTVKGSGNAKAASTMPEFDSFEELLDWNMKNS